MMFQKISKSTAKAALGVLLSIYTVNSWAMVGKLQEFRCAQDPFPPGEQGKSKVQQRVNWAWKCYPDVMQVFDFNKVVEKNMWDFPQGRVIAYPVFGFSIDGNITIMQAPTDENAACDTLSRLAPKQRISVVGFCGLGCLTPDQVVIFGEGPHAIGSKEAAKQSSVVTLQEGANLRDMRFQTTPLRQVVSDLEAKQQTILRITTASGDSIKVTENHPLVDDKGLVRRADTLKVGEALVRDSGLPEEIISIDKDSIFGKVYNLRIESSKIEENIYIAQGYLNGSSAIQNEHVDYLNRKLLRLGNLIDIDGIQE